MVLADVPLLKGRDPVDVCRHAVAGGATMVQVRWKDGAAPAIRDVATRLVAALDVPILVNDRVDVALAAGAAGAHLGQDDPPLDALRPHLPSGFLLGVSVGTREEAERARSWAADYWSVGPCYATTTKPDAGAALGPEGFAAVARLAAPGVPVLGIGGITPGNAGAVVAAGAAGVAVAAAVISARDPEAAARALRSAIAVA